MSKRKSTKIITWLVLSIFIVVSIVYYASSYLSDYELSFTLEHRFILFLFAICVLIMVGLSSFILYRNFKLEKLVKLVLEEIADAEDNTIEFNRTTQNMIMKLANSVGVDAHEKRL